jgi:anthranilate synthase/indole-3-glycerol phosphate synthase/phosphoribosylanthranilate isomerase
MPIAPRNPPSILDKIMAQRRLDVAAAKLKVPADELRKRIAARAPALDFAATVRAASSPLCLLAEMKRASPSKGDIATGIDAPQQALAYALAGACTISVLTEPTWFKGSLDDLANVRAGLEGAGKSPGVCVLRKDFLMDEYMLLEARAHGADTALLIVAVLEPEELSALIAASRALGMEPLVEVNTEAEMEIAMAAGAKVVGVNNRNLHTFEVDMGTTGRIAKMLPPGGGGVQLLALSGVATRSDAVDLQEVGAAGILVGESLMRAPNPAGLIRELLGKPDPNPLCKVCGLRDAEAAVCAVEAGADLVGLIFAPSKRQVSVDEAKKIVEAVRAARPRPAGWAMPKMPPQTVAGASDGEEGAARWLQVSTSLLAEGAKAGGPLVCGIFVNATAEEMNATAEAVGLDIIQLHGAEGWDVATQLCRPAVRVVHMEAGVSAADVRAQLRGGLVSAVLLDSKGGGTGKTFDWDVGGEVQSKVPFILAGGLTPANVADAVRKVKPWAVDVSSGVESDGVKDHEKIRGFVGGAKAALAA